MTAQNPGREPVEIQDRVIIAKARRFGWYINISTLFDGLALAELTGGTTTTYKKHPYDDHGRPWVWRPTKKSAMKFARKNVDRDYELEIRLDPWIKLTYHCLN